MGCVSSGSKGGLAVSGAHIHPWRQAPVLGFVGVQRSNRFSYYVQHLPPGERRRIESAEHAYVARTRHVNGLCASAERDFMEGMIGHREGSWA